MTKQEMKEAYLEEANFYDEKAKKLDSKVADTSSYSHEIWAAMQSRYKAKAGNYRNKAAELDIHPVDAALKFNKTLWYELFLSHSSLAERFGVLEAKADASDEKIQWAKLKEQQLEKAKEYLRKHDSIK